MVLIHDKTMPTDNFYHTFLQQKERKAIMGICKQNGAMAKLSSDFAVCNDSVNFMYIKIDATPYT